jgi:hypothetical protein
MENWGDAGLPATDDKRNGREGVVLGEDARNGRANNTIVLNEHNIPTTDEVQAFLMRCGAAASSARTELETSYLFRRAFASGYHDL